MVGLAVLDPGDSERGAMAFVPADPPLSLSLANESLLEGTRGADELDDSRDAVRTCWSGARVEVELEGERS